ncbi:MAG TPA: hypothetical protein VM529_23215 [Gemmata sp.]|nr:hypothetical protein [Gemmata sp.]
MSKNEGVRVIADFDDHAVPLATATPDGNATAARSANEGVRVLVGFDDRIAPHHPTSSSGLVRQQLDELDGLLQRMLSRPFESPEPAADKGQVAELIAQINAGMQTIHAAISEIKRIESKAG